MMDQTRSQQMDDYMKAHLKRSRRRKRILVVAAVLLLAIVWAIATACTAQEN